MSWNHVATFYQVGCIDKSRIIPGLKQRNRHKETPQWNHNSESSDTLQSWYLTEGCSIPSTLVRYSLRFSQGHWCYNNKRTDSISFMLRKTVPITLKKKETSYPPSHTITEDTIRHNIAQMTSTSKAYIHCLLATIIKCHIIAWDRIKIICKRYICKDKKTHIIY